MTNDPRDPRHPDNRPLDPRSPVVGSQGVPVHDSERRDRDQPDTRTPEEIERDIARERNELASTLNSLQEKFSVETLVRQVSDQLREHGGDIGRSVSQAVKRNPLALALTGIGLAWLMMGDQNGGRDHDRRWDRDDRTDRTYGDIRSRSLSDRDHDQDDDRDYGRPGARGLARASVSRYRPDRSRTTPSWARSDAFEDADGDADSGTGEKIRRAVASASDRAAALRDRLAEGTEDLTDEARERVISARQKAVEARDAAMSYLHEGRERAVDIFEEQPLVAGALAVALGAALGAALPRSQMEDDLFGDQSDHLIEEAERVFQQEKEKLGKVAQAATEEARKIADEHADDASSVAETIGEKARQSGERIAEAAKSEADKQNLGDVTRS